MLFTRNGHNMFDVSSLIQKALRRGDIEFSCYSAHEMMWKYRSYLWKRILYTTAEDCYDPITGRVYELRKQDLASGDPVNSRFLSEAINLIVRTRKNRDADFFACNYVYSKEKRDFPIGTTMLVTRHGHDLKAMTKELKVAIYNIDGENAGYIASEIWCWYKRLFWVVMKDIARELGSGIVAREILSLMEVDMTTNAKDGTWLYMSKAITMIFHCLDAGTCDIFETPDMRAIEDVLKYNQVRKLPEYTYDCHTRLGKMKGLTSDDFLITEQNSLNPYVRGLYDNSSWDVYRFRRVDGWGDDYNTPKLPKTTLDNVNNGIFPSSLFD